MNDFLWPWIEPLSETGNCGKQQSRREPIRNLNIAVRWCMDNIIWLTGYYRGVSVLLFVALLLSTEALHKPGVTLSHQLQQERRWEGKKEGQRDWWKGGGRKRERIQSGLGSIPVNVSTLTFQFQFSSMLNILVNSYSDQIQLKEKNVFSS